MKLEFQETAEFCGNLALLLHAGIGTADGVYLLAEKESGQRRELLDGLGKQLDQGGFLSDALESCGAFPDYAVGMVRVGERTGRLEEALEALAAYFEDRSRTEKQLRSALAYPSMLLMLMLVVIGVLLVKVLPVFDRVYASLGSQLTGIAGGLLALGQGLERAMPVLLAALAAGAVVMVLYSCWNGFRERANALGRKWFGDRGIWAKFNNARFAQGLSMGLSSGLPAEEAAELAEMLLREVPGAAERCRSCADALQNGTSLAEALESAGLLSAASCRMLTVGIRGGNGDRVMEQIARRMTEEANEALDRAVAKVEPAMVMAASILVGVILLSVMLPLMNILSAIG